MTDLDMLLGRLRDDPVHPGLAGIDDPVLEAVRRKAESGGGLSMRGVGLSAVVALGMGFAGSTLPAPSAHAGISSAPFGAPSALAPSTLLGDVDE